MTLEHPLDFVFNPFVSLFLLWLVPVVGWAKISETKGPLWAKILAPILLFLASSTFFGVGSLSWLWRDDLGLDAVTSSGMFAVERFLEAVWPLFLFSGFCLFAGMWVCRKAMKSAI
jgi:hypothetical protein